MTEIRNETSASYIGQCKSCGAALPPSKTRPYRYCPGGCKQKGYRRRKAAAGFEIGAEITHPQHGKGLVIRVNGDRVVSLFHTKTGKLWAELDAEKVTRYKNPYRAPRKRINQFNPNDPYHIIAAAAVGPYFDAGGCMEELRQAPIYRRKRSGRSRPYRDFTKVINTNLARMVEQAKRPRTK